MLFYYQVTSHKRPSPFYFIMSENTRNPNQSPPRKKRRWYYKCPKVNEEHKETPPTVAPPSSRQDTLKQQEKERIDNEKQVNKMEQQLHEYFHKTNMPYSYLDETGIYKFAPPPTSTVPASTAKPGSTTTSTNPFMNMTYTPSSLFHTQPQLFPNIWTTVIKFPLPATTEMAATTPTVANVSTTSTENVVSSSIPKPITPEIIEIRENIQHIDDLIALCDKYPLTESKQYNINMSAIHAIRQPLTELSNMIGMDTIKHTIVDQILYYLQDLHIPEKKEEIKENSPSISVTKDIREGLNPFSNPWFPNSNGGDVASNTANPFDFKSINAKFTSAWATNGDLSTPTKGDFMHTVIYGPPGSGKTEVAKIIGRIFSNLGILTKKTFKKVSRNDLIAGYLGQTAIKTKDMIKASLGGVLFIDEAYSLGNSEKRDSFAKECVDTLCEALSEHKHNWMVIIAGYEKELNDCFFSLNEGLNSRFTWRFKLDAYKPDELKSIYEKQVRDYGWTTTNTSTLPESWFAARMDYFTTYGRDMETLFTKTKIAHSRRVFCLPVSEKKIITMDDLENGYKLFIENPEVKERKERVGGGAYMKTLYL